MGRRAYDMAQGDLTGYEYQVPIFVVTHRPPEKAAKGQNDKLTLTFVSGVAEAIAKARAAAGAKDVTVIGGASMAQQCLAAGLVDEIDVILVPVLLGEGLRFFDGARRAPIELETVEVMESPVGTHIRLRVTRPRP